MAFWSCALIFGIGVMSTGLRVADGIELAIGRLWPGPHFLAIGVVRGCALIAASIGANLALQAHRRDLASVDSLLPEEVDPPLGWRDAGDVCEACGSEVWTQDGPEDETEESPPIEADHNQPGDVR